MLVHILKMGLTDTSHIQGSADLDGLADALSIIVALVGHIFQLDLVIHAAAGRIVAEAIQHILTRMKASAAKISLVLVVGLAFGVLEASALHVFREPLK